jgi:ferric-dicitrate binding protein FerR (iron transport regulator)
MAAAVVFPFAPLEECPSVRTTQRLSETDIDVSQARLSRNDNGVPIAKTLDLHLWSANSEEQKPSWPRQEAASPRMAEVARREAPAEPVRGLWKRRPALMVAAILLVALLGGCIAWLATR